MRKANQMRGLSDIELAALVESLPDGLALADDRGEQLWANRRARQLAAMRATTSPADRAGAELGLLMSRFVAALPPFRGEEHARWSLEGGGAVEVTLRRLWASQVALRLVPSRQVASSQYGDDGGAPLSPCQLILVERLVEEAAVGLVVADDGGHIGWMNRQAQRLLGGAPRRLGGGVERRVARAARHVASGRLPAPIRMQVELPTRVVEALFWSVAPGLAGVSFDGEAEEARAPSWRDRLIA